MTREELELQTIKEYLRKFHALWPMVEAIGIHCPDDGYYDWRGDYAQNPPSVFCIQLLDAQDNLIWSSDGFKIGETSGRQALYRSLRSFRKILRKFGRRKKT